MDRYRFICMFLLLSLTMDKLYGQIERSIKGTLVISNGATDAPTSEVEIINLTRAISIKPDNLGNFLIGAQIGDSLEFYRKGLPRKHFIINSYEHLTVYLDSTILLNEVNVNANIDKKTNLKETATAYSKQNSIYFGGKPPLALLSPFGGSPITFFRELLSEDGKRVRRFNRLIHQQLEYEELNALFNKRIIKQVIPTISDEEIEGFRTTYSPDLETFKNWSVYERYDYIKKSYQHFKEEP